MLLWAGMWPLEVFLLSRVVPGMGLDEEWLGTALIAYSNLVALWGAAKLSREVKLIEPTLSELTMGRVGAAQVFRGMESVWGPLLLMTAVLALFTLPDVLASPPLAFAVSAVWGFVAWLPLMVLIWTVGAVLLGLHRLGGMSLRLRPFEEDRSLGLRPLGALAFTPFLILVAALLPTWLDPTDLTDFLLDVGALMVGVLLLFASLFRLRRRMLAAKREHSGWVRGLYAQAVEGVRAGHSLEALRGQAAELQAAESLERHVAAIQEWPFDESLFRTMIAILTSITTAILARLVLGALHL